MPDARDLVTVLYLSWRCQEESGKSFVLPVGRLVRAIEPDGKVEYEFCYIEGLKTAQQFGMKPLLTFDQPEGVWRSPRLFPLFGSRIMSEQRPDYGQFLRDIHVSHDAAAAKDPLQVMVRSGGIKNTDWYEVFGWPEYEEERLVVRFWLRGLRHRGDAAEIAVQHIGKALSTSSSVEMMARPEVAETDPQAVAIVTMEGQHIGFMPRELTSLWHDLTTVHQAGATISAVKCNGKEVVPYYRLLCQLDSPWPTGFVPFSRDPRYQPISTEAWKIPGTSDPRELGRPRQLPVPVSV